MSASFRAFVVDENQRGRNLGLDHLLVLQHLLRHAEADTTQVLRLVAAVHRKLARPGDPERDRRTDWEAAKTRVLSVLAQRAAKGEPGLSNEEARSITLLDREQIKRLMRELRDEGGVMAEGRGRSARWIARPKA
jgi:ATP-dependent DNA helicase RecG